ncbi:hypothetical protein [Jannaschia pohangensis]|uniref:hypothetical protein n=1 Tax=Jannaschia pohangensis TaxID=390807 RepID=UPI000B83D7C6|nr:hypothetical protein [Jannaschia pohangensis]
MISALVSVGAILISILSFLFGRIFAQSETILAEKRKVYASFLDSFPTAQTVYEHWTPEVEMTRKAAIDRAMPKLQIYCAPSVAFAVQAYLEKFQKADEALGPDSPALDPLYLEVARAYNDIILEMRRDVLAWSVFAYNGKTRVNAPEIESDKQ